MLKSAEERWDEWIARCNFASSHSQLIAALQELRDVARENKEICTADRRAELIELGKAKKTDGNLEWNTEVAESFGRLLREFTLASKALSVARSWVHRGRQS